MDTLRTDLLLKYILAAAGEEERDNRELGAIHLLKYAYLGDLAHAERHAGSTFTQAAWRFYHFGPWAEEVHGRIDSIAEELGAARRTIVSSKFEKDSVRYSFSDETTLDRLEGQIPSEITRAIKFAIRRFHSDTSELLHFVYTTAPMLRAAPGEQLDFGYRPEEEGDEVRAEPTAESTEVQTDPAAVIVLSSLVKSKTRRRRELEAVRESVQARLRDAKQRRALATPVPRYDEVFFDGVQWLDGLAGPEIEVAGGEATFSSDVWKSRGRRDPGVP